MLAKLRDRQRTLRNKSTVSSAVTHDNTAVRLQMHATLPKDIHNYNTLAEIFIYDKDGNADKDGCIAVCDRGTGAAHVS